MNQLTGLPPGSMPKLASEMIDASRAGYVLVLFVKNLESVNRRVGFAVGDQILTLIGQSVGRHLSGGDQLFCWRGPCFIAVMERSTKHSHVLAEAAKIGSISLEEGSRGPRAVDIFQDSNDLDADTIPRNFANTRNLQTD